MKKVFHFVPSLDIGGVEIAIQKSLPELDGKVDVSIFYIRRRGHLDVRQKPWWRALKHIFFDRPDVVITSLWWAHPVGFFFRMAGVRWVSFIHLAGSAHAIDRIVCAASIWLADEVAADSDQTALFVRSIKKSANVHVIPYVFLPPVGCDEIKRIPDSFIFVGRNSSQKRLDLVVGFFRHILTKFSNVTCRFVIAGEASPDILNLTQSFGPRVTIELNIPNDEVVKRLFASEYFVVLSDYEGFCMAANEAVHAGCFVIYRDVGEIGNYVLPTLSFKVEEGENFHERFEKTFEARKQSGLVSSAGGIRYFGHIDKTYISSFISLINKTSPAR